MNDKSEQQLNEAWVKATQEELRQMRLQQEENRRACVGSIQQEVEQRERALQQSIQEEREQNIARLKLEIEVLKARLDECHKITAKVIAEILIRPKL